MLTASDGFQPLWPLKSLTPRKCGSNFKSILFKLIIQNTCSSLSTHFEIVLRWMPQNFINEKAILGQVMAWCYQAPSHYPTQCWPRPTSPCGISRPQSVLVLYSRIPLSRVPLTRENQLNALAPWTPNFSDAPLATAHMTDPVTHMCWSEQISPLGHSSQATWQPFNLSHCIEMHNTHLLGRAGQLSQTYFTHSAPILTPRNQPHNNGRHCENPVCYVTLASTPAGKRQLPRYFLVQMQLTSRYDHRSESDFLFLLCRKCRNLIYLKCDSRICHRDANPTLVNQR